MNINNKLMKKMKNVYVAYTILFVIFFICVFSPFWYYGKSFVWSMDGLTQHYSNILYFKQWFSEIFQSFRETGELIIPMWDLTLGFGQDVFSAVVFRPLTWLSLLWNVEYLESFFIFRSCVSLYIAGIGFLCFCLHEKNEKWSSIIGSLVYIFCGFSLYFSAKHAFFIELLIYLPFLLLGTIQIMETGRSFLFIIVIGFCSLSYLYFLYIITIPAIIFSFCKYLQKEKKGFGDFCKTLLTYSLHYLLGMGIGAVSLIPNFYIMQESGRSALVTIDNYLTYDLKYYLQLLTSFVDVTQLSLYGFIGLSGIVVLSIMALIMQRDKKARTLLIQVLIYGICFLSPLFSVFFNGFAANTERWSFIFAFWASCAVAYALPRLLELDKEKWRKGCFYICVYIVIYIIIKNILQEGLASGVCVLALYFCICIMTMFKGVQKKKKSVYIIVLALLCMELTLKSYELYAPWGEDYISEFVDRGDVWNEKNNTSAEILASIEDTEDYRVDVVVPLNTKYRTRNYGTGLNIAGISSYYSYLQENVKNYMLDLGNSQIYQPFLIYDFDQRTVLNLLAGVKYATNTDSNINRIPYGYDLVDTMDKEYTNGTVENIYLYENKYALPLMYTYDTYIPRHVFDELSANEKEQAMLQGCVLEESDFPETNLTFDYNVLLDSKAIYSQIQEQIDNGASVELEGTKIKVLQDNVTLNLKIPSGYCGELHFCADNAAFSDIDFTDSKNENMSIYETRIWKFQQWQNNETASATITASMEQMRSNCTLFTSKHQYYYGSSNVIINLGYCETGDSLYLSFSKAGEYDFDDLNLISQPMENYGEKVKKLAENPVTNVEITQNSITGSLDCSKNQLLCIAVPYASGWSAFVDGEETEIQLANGMYMSIDVPKGEHEVQLVYTTLGLKKGAMFSCGTLVVVIVYGIIVIVQNRMRKGKG